MFEVLNKELNIRVLMLDNNQDTYYLSYQGNTKCVIDIKQVDNDIIIFPAPQGECTVEQLHAIISCFCDFIFKKYPETNGILFKTDPNEMLENIGFKLTNENSEYLYKENKRINKVK